MANKSWSTIGDDFNRWAKSLKRLAKETEALFDFVERATSAAKLAAAREDDRFVQLKDQEAKRIARGYRDLIGVLGAPNPTIKEKITEIARYADDAANWMNRAVEEHEILQTAQASRDAIAEGAEPQA